MGFKQFWRTIKQWQKRCAIILVILLTANLLPCKPLVAQKPFLLQTIAQRYNYSTDTFDTEYTETYAYDSESRMIKKNRMWLPPCQDCTFYVNPEPASSTENWTFSKFGRETSYMKVSKWWVKMEPESTLEMETGYIENRKTTYNEDTLVLESFVSKVYLGQWRVNTNSSETKTFEYNKMRKITRETQQESELIGLTPNGTENNRGYWRNIDYTYDKGGLLLSEHIQSKGFQNGDTTDVRYTKNSYTYNAGGQLESKITEAEQFSGVYKTKIEYRYNSDGLVSRTENFYFDNVVNNWISYVSTDYEYYTTGVIRRSIESRRNGSINKITTTDYDTYGRVIFAKGELYDDQMVLIGEEYHSETEWINEKSNEYTVYFDDYFLRLFDLHESDASGNPLVELIEVEQRFLISGDSWDIRSSLNQTLYEYDNSGSLIRTRETRVNYEGDSIVSAGCCGWQGEAESIFTNRCDGVPESKERTEFTYISGTKNEFFPNPNITREFYTYSPAWCEEKTDKELLVVYPNPSSGEVQIISDLLFMPHTRLFLVSTDGSIIRQTDAPVASDLTIDFTGMAAGVYIVKLENGTTHAVERVVVLP